MMSLSLPAAQFRCYSGVDPRVTVFLRLASEAAVEPRSPQAPLLGEDSGLFGLFVFLVSHVDRAGPVLTHLGPIWSQRINGSD